jgi:hypothetical protein
LLNILLIYLDLAIRVDLSGDPATKDFYVSQTADKVQGEF